MKRFDAILIGAPCLDFIIPSNNAIQNHLVGHHDGRVEISSDEFSDLLSLSTSPPKQIPGGSACNVAKGLSTLGSASLFIGKIGNDEAADQIKNSLSHYNVQTHFIPSNSSTARIACIVHRDGRRTFRALPGASSSLTIQSIPIELFSKTQLIHLEGYTLFNGSLVLECLKAAKQSQCLFSIDLGSYEVVRQFKQVLLSKVLPKCDIVFCNDLEAKELTTFSPEEAAKELSHTSSTIIVSTGETGGWVGQDGRAAPFESFPAKVIDTTGAGDLFAAGFLHAYLQKRPIEACTKLGAMAASKGVERYGAEVPINEWEKLGRMQ